MARSGAASGRPATVDEFFALPVAPVRHQLVEGPRVVHQSQSPEPFVP